MKQNIHPDYHKITIIRTDGSSYETRSTYGKEGDSIRVDVDPLTHPAWTGGEQHLLDRGGQLARFSKRFQGFGLDVETKKEAMARAKKEAEEAK